MEIDFIIPAKTSSMRIPMKNWREFHDGRCLVDITIEGLLGAGVDKSRIHVSCESHQTANPVCEKHGVNLLLRGEALCRNDFPVTDWMRAICSQVPGNSDIAWCQVCDPLFDEQQEFIDGWALAKKQGHDSRCVVYPRHTYLMGVDHEPIGWQFGEYHTPSQDLPQTYQFPFTMSILTRRAVARYGYHIGGKPSWFHSLCPGIDIDYELDFEIAQLYYERKMK
jgi:N-acylneuraminate cytidylyltransferase